MTTEDLHLLPCPFCGGEPRLETIPVRTAFIPSGEIHNIECCVCHASIGPDEGKAEQIAKWNRRSYRLQDMPRIDHSNDPPDVPSVL